MSKLRTAPRSRPLWVGLFALIFCAWALTSPDEVDARPGGGQNYRAPSRSSSSSSGSSRSYSGGSSYSGSSSRSYSGSSSTYSGSSSSGYSSGSSTVYVPSGGGGGCGAVGWIAILFIMGVLVYMYYTSAKGRKKAEQRATIDVNEKTAAKGLRALRSQDPEFDPQAFVQRTITVVQKVNETWLAGDMGPARRVISDGVYVRFSTQLALLKADGLRNVMANWRVVSADILAAESDPQWDTVHVKVVGAARDLDVSVNLTEETIKKKMSGAQLNEYEEVWSFVRRRGKHSKKGVPALEGRCPSCGAEMPLSQVVKCEYCQALVNSGEHDWVLAEITQPEEWRAGAAVDEIPGFDELRQRDAAVSRQELEDRASVIFWKWIEARTTGKLQKLARFCVYPPTDSTSAANLGIGTGGVKLRQVAVGSAELKVAAAAGSAEEMDNATVEIRWSASIDGADSAFNLHRFTLARQGNVQSKRGMSSLDCPVCGGQLAGSDAVTCTYCGTTLSGGKHEWALVAVDQGTLPPDEGYDGGGGDDDGDGPSYELSTPGQKALGALGIGLAVAGVMADVVSNSGDSDDD